MHTQVHNALHNRHHFHFLRIVGQYPLIPFEPDSPELVEVHLQGHKPFIREADGAVGHVVLDQKLLPLSQLLVEYDQFLVTSNPDLVLIIDFKSENFLRHFLELEIEIANYLVCIKGRHHHLAFSTREDGQGAFVSQREFFDVDRSVEDVLNVRGVELVQVRVEYKSVRG